MTQPAGPVWRQPGYWSPVRLLAVASTIATLVIGIVIVVTTFHSQSSFQDWMGAGIISAGVALACVFLL